MPRRTRRGRGLAWTAGLAAALMALSGCGATPAKPLDAAPAREVVVPNGEYDVSVHSAWAGPLRARMIFEATPEGFKANTRPGVAWGMVGGIESVLGPIFAPFLFPRGMILTWTSPMPGVDEQGRRTPGVGRIGVGEMGSLNVDAQFTSADERVVIRLRDGRAAAAITLTPAASDARPTTTDYAALAARTGELLRAHVHDPELASSRAFDSGMRAFAENAAKATDDAEFIFGAIVAARSNLSTSMPLMYPRPDPAQGREALAGIDNLARPYLVVEDAKTGFTTLRFYAFLDTAMVDEAFAAALGTAPRALILDLRRTPGVEPAAFRVASLLIDAPLDVGWLFTRPRRDEALKDPAAAPHAHVTASGRELDESVRSALDADGLVRLTIAPDLASPLRWGGPVVVLTARRTGSSAELLADLLKRSGRAELVGEPTAGRPMMSGEFDPGQGWVLRIPSIDHAPPEGPRLNGRGVSPDVRTGRGDAPDVATRRLLERLGEQPVKAQGPG